MRRRYPILLSFVLVTLLSIGSVELFYRSLGQSLTGEKAIVPISEPETKQGTKTDTAAPVPIKKPAVREKKEDYSVITKRNLFGKAEEKAIEKVVEAKPVMTATSLDLVLLGTIGGTSNDQRAFIRNKKNKSQDIYYKGDAIEHAFIKEISRGQIILTVNGKDEILLMEEAKSPKGSSGGKNKSAEIYSLADAMEKEKQSKPQSRQNKSPRKDKSLQLEKNLR